MNNGDLGYLAYLVRIWQVRSRGQLVWRASVENAHTGERQAFANLERLVGFLEEVTGCPVRNVESLRSNGAQGLEPPAADEV